MNVSLKPSGSRYLLLLLYLLPIAALIWLVADAGVDIPFRDQWSLVPFFEKVSQGTVQFSDVYAQHNEHRIFFPRIVLSLLAFATQWNIGWEYCLSIFFGLVTFLALFAISIRTSFCAVQRGGSLLSLAQRTVLFHAVNVITCCLVFSWTQHQNWLWGFQSVWFFICTCLALSVMVLVWPTILPGVRMAIAAVICFVASFSSAHGLFLWIAVVPAIAAIPGKLKAVWLRLLVWGLLFLACLGLYLMGYSSQSNQIATDSTWLGYLSYFFVQVGSAFVGLRSPTAAVMVAGVVIELAFVGLVAYGWLRFSTQFFYRAAPWISIGLFSGVFALANTYGRYEHGLGHAREGRYTTANVFVLIALVQLLPVAIDFWRIRVKSWAVLAMSAVLLAIHFGAYPAEYQEAKYGERGIAAREEQALCVNLVEYLQAEAFAQCFETESTTWADAERLTRLGFREAASEVSFVADGTLPRSAAEAFARSDGTIEVVGRTTFSDSELSSPAVLLALEGTRSFVAISYFDADWVRNGAELVWTAAFVPGFNLASIEDADWLDIYFYYPQLQQFVRAGQVQVSSAVLEAADYQRS